MTDRNESKGATSLAHPRAAAAVTGAVYPARLTTVARSPRLWLLGLLLAACGGRAHEDTYQHAQAAEQQCCEHLSGAARDQCLAQVVRVDDPAVARSPTNQDTFACVQDHFQCDATTGRATRDSAQAQLDCIQDLTQ